MPKERLIRAITSKGLAEIPDSESELEIPSFTRHYSTHANLVPLQNAVQPTRIFYGARFVNQAMPLENPEEPLVQALDPESGKSFDQQMGTRAGAILADAPAEVLSVGKGRLKLRLDNGEEVEKRYQESIPFNRYTRLAQRPVVAKGDRVKPGDSLVVSNYTSPRGVLALGVNARVALVPYKGYSMDDAIVISEPFAQRLKSEHVYKFREEWRDGAKSGKAHYSSLFPKSFTKEQLDKLDDDGVPLPGTVIMPGDPILLATKPKTINSAGSLTRTNRMTRADSSQIWEENYPAIVDHVIKKPGFTKVVVRGYAPAAEGDKIVFRAGQKSYHPDTEVFTRRGWVRIGELLKSDELACLFDDREQCFENGAERLKNTGQKLVARFAKPYDAHTYEFDGLLYGLYTQWAAYLTTPNHRIWRKGYGNNCAGWSCLDAKQVHGGHHKFMIRAPFDLSDRKDPDYFEVGLSNQGPADNQADRQTRFDFRTWVRFMAVYLLKGGIFRDERNDYIIVIPQKEKFFCADIECILDGMGLEWKFVGERYIIRADRAFVFYLKQFGRASGKYVPDEIKNAGAETINLFLDTIWRCNRIGNRGKKYRTLSFRMAEDIQQLLILTGKAVKISRRFTNRHRNRPWYIVSIFDCDSVGIRKNCEYAYFTERYTGPVFCVQVPGEGVILTRFRGRVMWNGNSIISKILPASEMPRGEDGEPFDVLLNPLGMPSRVNFATPYELLFGKIAKADGKPVILPGFNAPGESWKERLRKELAARGLKDKERIYDPKHNRWLDEPVTTGYGYVLKLHHVAAHKADSRGQGAYTMDEQPAKGGEGGAKRISGLEINALLSSGGYETLKESVLLRGQKNDEYWRALRAGITPKPPGRPFVWEKFLRLLNGAGIEVSERSKGRLVLGPFTDKHLMEKKPREIFNPALVDLYDFSPLPGGLFDPNVISSNSWGFIRLPEPEINPMFEDGARALLGLKRKELEAIMLGQMELPQHLKDRIAAKFRKKAEDDDDVLDDEEIEDVAETIDLRENEARNLARTLWPYVTQDPDFRWRDYEKKLSEAQVDPSPKNIGDAWLSAFWLSMADPDFEPQSLEFEDAVNHAADRARELKQRLEETGSLRRHG